MSRIRNENRIRIIIRIGMRSRWVDIRGVVIEESEGDMRCENERDGMRE